ncbi:MAG: hypothetical protein M1286_01800 [Candidatus Marsarchaeota archaeon]|nr:hypothetical protein [Candidatus Marsarchaeota archaeon]
MRGSRQIDPVLEELYPNAGTELSFVKERYPHMFYAFRNDLSQVRRRSGMAFEAASRSVTEFSLVHASASLYESMQRAAGDQFNPSDVASLIRREAKLKRAYACKPSWTYMRDFADEAASRVGGVVMDVGRYGRIEIYGHMVRYLDRLTRQRQPWADLQIDLTIKSVLRAEPDQQVRKIALKDSGMGDRDTLSLGDLFVWDRWMEREPRKSI